MQAKRLSAGCPYLKAKPSSQQHFQDALLAAPLDVEELARLGRRKAICPYYAARAALPQADLLLLPYGALLLQVRTACLRRSNRLSAAVTVVATLWWFARWLLPGPVQVSET